MRNEPVRDFMTEAVLSIDIEEPVTEVLRLFAEYPVHHLPVVSNGALRGMLSSADILKLKGFIPDTHAPGALALLSRFKIETLMRKPAVTVGLDETIAEAASRMVTHAIHALPVVNENDGLVGIVTTTDIMHALLYGVRPRGAPVHDSRRKPVELESLEAMKAAQSAVQTGADTHGVAASLLYLKERNRLLEQFRENVARYLHGGQPSELHALVLRDLEKLEPEAPLPLRL